MRRLARYVDIKTIAICRDDAAPAADMADVMLDAAQRQCTAIREMDEAAARPHAILDPAARAFGEFQGAGA